MLGKDSCEAPCPARGAAKLERSMVFYFPLKTSFLQLKTIQGNALGGSEDAGRLTPERIHYRNTQVPPAAGGEHHRVGPPPEPRRAERV